MKKRTKPNRLLIDIRENGQTELVGSVQFPADSLFVLEALRLVLAEFSQSCGVPPEEIALDLVRRIKQ